MNHDSEYAKISFYDRNPRAREGAQVTTKVCLMRCLRSPWSTHRNTPLGSRDRLSVMVKVSVVQEKDLVKWTIRGILRLAVTFYRY